MPYAKKPIDLYSLLPLVTDPTEAEQEAEKARRMQEDDSRAKELFEQYKRSGYLKPI